MADGDVLFDIRNYFLLASFQSCITEAQKLKVYHVPPEPLTLIIIANAADR